MSTLVETGVADIEDLATAVKRATYVDARQLSVQIKRTIQNVLSWTKASPSLCYAADVAAGEGDAFATLLRERGQVVQRVDPEIALARKRALAALKALQIALPAGPVRSIEGETLPIR